MLDDTMMVPVACAFLLLAAADTDSTTLREDPKTGAMELMARYPSGHISKAHSHELNERIVLLEGALHLKQGGEARDLAAGGYTFIPAKQEHSFECTSKTQCRFYVSWSRE